MRKIPWIYRILTVLALGIAFFGKIQPFIDEFYPADSGVYGDAAQDEYEDAFSPVFYAGCEVPPFDGSSPYMELNDGVPFFTEKEKDSSEVFEEYSSLDGLGRCGTAYASVCQELMPTEERGEIGQVRPSGWHTVKYPGVVSGNYLYNRCHLIGYQLAGENANEENLITGTRYLNIEGMLPFENEIADYVQETGNSVLYRVTPVYDGDDLVCRGVVMEAWSREDGGRGVCFCVFAYNAQPGVEIDYSDGGSRLMK